VARCLNPERKRSALVFYLLTPAIFDVLGIVFSLLGFFYPSNFSLEQKLTVVMMAVCFSSPCLYFPFALTAYLEKSRRVIWPSCLIYCVLALAWIVATVALANYSANQSILPQILVGLLFYLIYLFVAGIVLVKNAPCTDKEWAVVLHAIIGPLPLFFSMIILQVTANKFGALIQEKKKKERELKYASSTDPAQGFGITGIFISYRRKDGMDLARNIRFVLKEAQIADCAFFDVESLGEGRWNEQIKEAIEKSNCFLILLTPSSLENRGENDYFLREVKTIVEKDPRKNKVIPILSERFSWPEHLESPLKELAERQDIEISSRYFDASMERLLAYIKGE
jgi:hypothetical protein